MAGYIFLKSYIGGIPRGEMPNVQDCDIAESEFEHQLRIYVHFQTNFLDKSINSLIPTGMR